MRAGQGRGKRSTQVQPSMGRAKTCLSQGQAQQAVASHRISSAGVSSNNNVSGSISIIHCIALLGCAARLPLGGTVGAAAAQQGAGGAVSAPSKASAQGSRACGRGEVRGGAGVWAARPTAGQAGARRAGGEGRGPGSAGMPARLAYHPQRLPAMLPDAPSLSIGRGLSSVQSSAGVAAPAPAPSPHPPHGRACR